MVIKIGGVEIDKTSKVEEITQLRAGLEELEVSGIIDGYNWLSELTVEERWHFAQIVSEHIGDSLVTFFTFGIF